MDTDSIDKKTYASPGIQKLILHPVRQAVASTVKLSFKTVMTTIMPKHKLNLTFSKIISSFTNKSQKVHL